MVGGVMEGERKIFRRAGYQNHRPDIMILGIFQSYNKIYEDLDKL